MRVAALALASVVGSASLADRLDPEVLGPRDGLPVESIEALTVDSSGMLWIGAREGLFRYDGYDFARYQHDVEDPGSLRDSWVKSIFEDASGTLWIGTNSGGLHRFDRARGHFVAFGHDPGNPASLSSNSVYAIAAAHPGSLWVGTQLGLNLLDVATGHIERVPLLPQDHPRRGQEFVLSLARESDDVVWAAVLGGGVLRYARSTGSVTELPVDPDDSHALATADAFALAFDAERRLWIGLRDGGARLSADGKILERLIFLGSDGQPRPPSIVTRVLADPAGGVWVASFSGVYRFDDGTTSVSTIATPAAPPELSTWKVATALGTDRDGTLWIGSAGHGLLRVRERPAAIRTLSLRGGGLALMSVPEISALHEDPDGTLWVGSFGGGLDRLDPGATELVRFRFSHSAQRVATGVLRITRAPDGRLWIGSSRGVLVIDQSEDSVTAYEPNPADPTALAPGYHHALLVDRGGRVWIGSGVSGLQRLSEDETAFETIPIEDSSGTALENVFVTALHEDRAGRLWMGTRSSGLFLVDRERDIALGLTVDAANPEAVPHPFITDILESTCNGAIWIGTSGGGLLRTLEVGPGTKAKFERITARDGLLDDSITALVEELDGTLWIGSRRGLTRHAPDTGLFLSYGSADGLASAEVNMGARTRSRRGALFGTRRGLVVVEDGAPLLYPEPSPIAFSEILRRGASANETASTWPPREIRLAQSDILTLRFAVLDFDLHRRHRYAYRGLEGATEWTDLGATRELTFANLPAGQHRLEIRGRSARGEWSDPPLSLTLRVVPPFYRTIWFRGLVLAAVFGAGLAWHRRRTRVLERRNKELTALQRAREDALMAAQAKELALQGAVARLRETSRRLEVAQEDERRRIARELHDEMGQLLTAAKINVQLLEKVPLDESAGLRVTDTTAIIDRMIGLVRTLSFALRPPLIDEIGLKGAVQALIDSQSWRTNLSIRLETSDDVDELPAEVETAAYRIVQEALTNVARHAHAKKAVIRLKRSGDSLVVTVEDDGVGFDATAITDAPALLPSTGLPGMNERAQNLGGSWRIDSKPGRGTRVQADLPCSRDSKKEEGH